MLLLDSLIQRHPWVTGNYVIYNLRRKKSPGLLCYTQGVEEITQTALLHTGSGRNHLDCSVTHREWKKSPGLLCYTQGEEEITRTALLHTGSGRNHPDCSVTHREWKKSPGLLCYTQGVELVFCGDTSQFQWASTILTFSWGLAIFAGHTFMQFTKIHIFFNITFYIVCSTFTSCTIYKNIS